MSEMSETDATTYADRKAYQNFGAANERAVIASLVRRWYESGGFDDKTGTFALKCLLDELEKAPPAATEATTP